MVTQKINLNLVPGGVLPRVKMSQYDNQGRYIEATLYSGVNKFTVPSGCVVYIQGTKRDKTGFQYTCSVNGAVVTAPVTKQMCAFSGDVMTELVIMQGSNRIGTGNFILDVESAALSDDTIISETDIPIIERLPEIVADLSESVQTTIENAAKAQQSADDAETSAAQAAQSATNAATAQTGAETARGAAAQYANDAEIAKTVAENAQTAAETARDTAETHAQTASDKADESKDYADLSKSYAVGTDGEVRTGDGTDNSKYYSEQAKNSATAANASQQAAEDAVAEVQQRIDDALGTDIPNVWIDLSTGQLMWEGGRFVFSVDTTTGNLMWEVAA